MKIILLFFVLIPYILFSQDLSKESQEWFNKNLKDTNVTLGELLTKFSGNDFSEIWLEHNDLTKGFIGNYRRFDIRFLKITKCDSTPLTYYVKGKSKVNNNICDFEGTITIKHIRQVDKQENEELVRLGILHRDSNMINRHKFKEYMILSEYEFKENPSQNESGIFNGVMKSYFYVKNKKVLYNGLDLGSDSYSNNQCVGVWKSYTTGAVQRCNWGEFRIPNCGDLDTGASEFIPNISKYHDKGWKRYFDYVVNLNKEAEKEEHRKWWLNE